MHTCTHTDAHNTDAHACTHTYKHKHILETNFKEAGFRFHLILSICSPGKGAAEAGFYALCIMLPLCGHPYHAILPVNSLLQTDMFVFSSPAAEP